MDHLVLACVDPAHDAHRARFVFEEPKKGLGQEDAFTFPALTRGQAMTRLAALLEDLLTGDHAVLMPIEAVLAGWGKGPLTPEGIQDYVDELMETEEPRFSTLSGPVPDPLAYPPPADPQALAETRLGPFLEAVKPAAQADAEEED